MAAGSFVTRAFESMLKECGGKNYPNLRTAIQTYYENMYKAGEPKASEVDQKVSTGGSSYENEGGAGRSVTDPNESEKSQQSPDAAEKITTATALAKSGQTLEISQAELVLNPLKYAFETRNLKIIELALDCLHKLLQYDHLEGDTGLDGGGNVQQYTDILNMVCSCADDSSTDSIVVQVLKVLLSAVASTKFRVHGEPLLGIVQVCYNITLNSKCPMNQATSRALLTQMISIISKRMETHPVWNGAQVSSGHTESNAAEITNSKLEESSSNDQIDRDMSLGDEQVKEGDIPTVKHLQYLGRRADVKALEDALAKAVYLQDGKTIGRGIDLKSMSIGKHDALLVFRSLCKMSMKDNADAITTSTRILSLELLQNLLEGVNDSFTKDVHLIDSVKAYLSYALLRASTSDSHVIFKYSTGIFSVLLLRYRESLKGEISIFLPLIILRLLEESDYPYKTLTVLWLLEELFKDPQMLIDLYVNFDCDLEMPNLFQQTITCLSRIIQGSSDDDIFPESQTYSTKTLSLKCVLNLLKSLSYWEKSHRESEKQSAVHHSVKEDISDGGSSEIKREDIPRPLTSENTDNSAMKAAISEFNKHPAKGVEYLLSTNLVEKTPSSVAQFLRNAHGLDKAMIGDYLGLHDEFPVAVMHAYIDSMTFCGMKFDMAMQEFLKAFFLPGDAQKIDRIFGKFAERYSADNPGRFNTSEIAYFLAYTVIVLNTSAHNPTLSPKMSKEKFIQLSSLNDDKEHVRTEILEEIYDSVVQKEIKYGVVGTGDERDRLVRILNLALPRKRSSSVDKFENDAIIKQIQPILRRKGKKTGVFYISKQIEILRLAVEAVGWPLLATFSVTMEEGDNKPRILLCMEGFKTGILLTHVLGMDTMRYAYLTSLVRFTFLHNPKELCSRNVEALRTLLTLCDVEPGSLQDTWNAILECASRLEFIISTPDISAIVMNGTNPMSRDAVLRSLKELAGKPAGQVFMTTSKFPSDSIVEFFSALCGVSAKELKQLPPRIYSLQKLVEISYYNMARVHMVWAKLWTLLTNHFTRTANHNDKKIAKYAMDALRQLSMEYLDHFELPSFTFQNEIFEPFVVLMRTTESQLIRCLTLGSVLEIIKSKVRRLKSGWASIFTIFTAAAEDEMESVVESGFENLEQVVLEHLDQVDGNCFMDCINCLFKYAGNKRSHRISLKAIALLRICEDRLAEGIKLRFALKRTSADEDATYDVTERYWSPMLSGLYGLTSDPRPEVRNCALDLLFDMLTERGNTFSAPFWENIFDSVLFPIFNHVRVAMEESLISSGDKFRETSVHSLQLLCNLFNSSYRVVSFMLPQLLNLLFGCAIKTNQTVVSVSLGALVHLIEVGGNQLSERDWDRLLKSIRDAVYETQPLELLNDWDLKAISCQSEVKASDSACSKSADDGKVQHLASQNGAATVTSNSTASSLPDQSQVSSTRISSVGPGGIQEPAGGAQKTSAIGGLKRNQTFGQRIMENMFDNLFRKTPSNTETHASGASATSLSKVRDVLPPAIIEESPLMSAIRCKCITQLLLLGAIDSIQRKCWSKLTGPQKISVIDVLLSLLEFAASFNSHTNLRKRMSYIPPGRPPMNLLRQELAGTRIYLDILQKTASGSVKKDENLDPNGSTGLNVTAVSRKSVPPELCDTEKKLEEIAELKLVSFCKQVLKEASDLQYNGGESTNIEVHRVLELRSPIIVKVLQGMCFMNHTIFRRHLREFYPLITKLVFCNRLEVRGALGELFRTQLKALIPKRS